MYEEIKKLNDMVPSDQLKDIAFMERNKFFQKKPESPTKSLFKMDKQYNGPEILPLMPKYLASKMKYSEVLEAQKMSNMEILKRDVQQKLSHGKYSHFNVKRQSLA